MHLTIGSAIPSFSITDTDKHAITEHHLKGKITLLLFFPLAFTSTCTKELCAVRDDLSRYNNLHVRVIGISTDSFFALAKYKEEQQLNFTLASDYNKDMAAAFGCLYDNFYGMHGVAKRAAFVIDGNLNVCYAEVLENASDIPDFNAINTILNTLAGKVSA
jgi:peroxiredoxin